LIAFADTARAYLDGPGAVVNHTPTADDFVGSEPNNPAKLARGVPERTDETRLLEEQQVTQNDKLDRAREQLRRSERELLRSLQETQDEAEDTMRRAHREAAMLLSEAEQSARIQRERAAVAAAEARSELMQFDCRLTSLALDEGPQSIEFNRLDER
jgi:hypothetical protein